MDKDVCLSHPDAYYLQCIEKDDVADTTKDNYRFSLQRLQKCLPGKSLCQIMLSPIESFKAIQACITNTGSLQTICASMLAVFKHSGIKAKYPQLWQAWYDQFHPVSAELVKQRESNVPTQNQELARIDWDVVTKRLDLLSRKAHGSRSHVLLALYTLLPPRRQEDYFSVYIYQDPNDIYPKDLHHAYIDLTIPKPIIHVRDFKTAAALRPWTKELPPRLLSIIQKSLVLTPRQYLFTQSNGKPYTTTNSFTKFNNRTLKAMFGEDVTLNSLRHSYSSKIKQDNNLSVAEHKQVAKDMGHSQATNMTYAFITPIKKKNAKTA